MNLIQRIITYVISTLFYYAFWKISGSFELTVILALGQIIGELYHKN